ncbi:helix-turn-helix domain-containing protein [Caballeronia sordidicola]|jgi:plasmid maintenance system antidote protein VapI|uniref:HTH cro/C1-type domain-containing protein n=1 Tax=Caballeronia sordidicola TaxID=196367 RepID=A0A242ME46_CABSO|nr:helix-turn-helix transcriptional regulator [Caballeronia sordidicola]OTP69460.1 hypothetical protein PAMC26577_30945 [Caballeronia sordidicola]
MRLKDYLLKERITQRQFAEKMNPPLHVNHLNRYLNGAVEISVARAVEIEKLTHGKVKPEDWLNWPEK